MKQLQDLHFLATAVYTATTTSLRIRQDLSWDLNFAFHNTAVIGNGLQDFGDNLVDTGVARLPTSNSDMSAPPNQGSPEEHRKLFSAGRSVLRAVSASPIMQKAATPLLFHPDLHARNFFVPEHGPTVVADIIDWQGASVEPGSCPEDETCAKAFAACSACLVPKLSLPQQMDEHLFWPYRYWYRMWKDGIAAYRHEITETLEHWDNLRLQVDRPEVDPNVIYEDKKAYDLFVTAQTLKKDLAGLLECAIDGWVGAEVYSATKKAHDELFQGMLLAVLDDTDPDPAETVEDEDTMRAIWPFDLEV
ncbi:hypothetical protein CERZMDRAFT_112776 [Cercospora zeae-maydis SCOH1-5]|uniref:Altered inheritance of mitochondria protein 9, mitochondrial n=1 Tax=Cercospora zeae-maydis SCOH1-5 TaxID=717836 RepID=A0A6A6FD70_9PEZI|nr:hypothetical protein CERZMDRAFT_112776 [Cercospora zeae-maydis SCOH1-5]